MARARRTSLIVAAWFGRFALAAVWIVEGLWAKVLGKRADELAILAQSGLVGDGKAALIAIGVAETALGVAILLPLFPRLIALIQTLLIVGFNTAGLVMGGEYIPDPVDLLSKNAAIVALAWVVALVPRRT